MASALRFVRPPIPHRPPTPLFPHPPPTASRFAPPISSPPLRTADFNASYRSSSSVRGPIPDDGNQDSVEESTFDRAVELFNGGDYHRCHDVLEELWTETEEPARTVLHGILQCAVGFHHLFNQNHRGAMMELGEGLCKLRKLGFDSGGPLFRFEKDVSEVLEFVYQTQKELAACSDDLCVAMDGSERSYQLLGSFAAGQRLYSLDIGKDGVLCIIFSPNHIKASDKSLRVRVPTLTASEEDLKAFWIQTIEDYWSNHKNIVESNRN